MTLSFTQWLSQRVSDSSFDCSDNERQWKTTKDNERQLKTMKHNETQWKTIKYNKTQWKTIKDNDDRDIDSDLVM